MKDDMTAFIEGLGMRRFFGYVECEEVPSVLWDSGQNPDGWKDFVELAKSTGAPFLTVHSWTLDREELDRMTQVLSDSEGSSAAVATRSVNCVTTASCLSRSRAPALVSTWTRT